MAILDHASKYLEKQGLNKGGNSCELYFEKSSNLSIDVVDGKVDTLSQSTDQGLSIRIIKDGASGFAYTFDLSEKAVENAIDNAIAVSELMTKDEANILGSFANQDYRKFEYYDERGLQASLEEKIAIARDLEANCKAKDSRIKRVRKSGYDETKYETTLVDSSGNRLQSRGTTFVTYITAVAEEGDQAEMGSDAAYSNFYKDLHPENVAINAARKSTELLGATKASSMQCAAVFRNEVTASLLSFLSASFSAENVDKNFSLLAGKLGLRTFSDKLSLYDDALLENGIASTPFDGEGTPSRKNILVENGVVKTFLYDGYYAKKLSMKSTASSRRGGLKSPPSIGPSNLYLEKGSNSLDHLISTAGNGILITSILGLHTANPITGDFSLGASGILIENGKLTRPVKGFAIAGNLLELLSQIEEVGSDFRFFGSVGTSSLLFKKLSVGGAT